MRLLGVDGQTPPTVAEPIAARSERSRAADPIVMDAPAPATQWSAGLLSLVAIGAAFGPGGMAILTPGILDLVDPAIPMALAAMGVLAGLDLGTNTPAGERRLRAIAGVQTVLIVATVSLGTALLAPLLGATATPTWILAGVAGICAASAAPSPDTGPAESSALAARRLDDFVPILLGALFLAWMRDSSLAAAGLTAQATGVALAIAAAGWLLLHHPSSETEQRIFTVAMLLLLGGVADYLSMSALFGGMVAGAFWRRVGGATPAAVWRHVIYVRPPLLALLLIVAGARSTISPGVLALGIGYALLRGAGVLTAGALNPRKAHATASASASASPSLLAPGILGIAFALNAFRAVGPDMAPALAVVVVGTVASQALALIRHPGGSAE
jgi:hypothetical protein